MDFRVLFIQFPNTMMFISHGNEIAIFEKSPWILGKALFTCVGSSSCIPLLFDQESFRVIDL